MPDEDELQMTESTRKEIEALGLMGPVYYRGKLVKVVPDIEAREMVVVCMPQSVAHIFKDDVNAKCADCEIGIYHRPHLPLGAITICPTCYTVRALKENPNAEIPDFFRGLSRGGL